jgi:hypothetical protein
MLQPEDLFNNYKRYAESIAIKFYKRHFKLHKDNAISIEDIKQEALTGLWFTIKVAHDKGREVNTAFLGNGIYFALYTFMRANKNSTNIANSKCLDMEDYEDLMLDEKWVRIVNNEILIKELLLKYIDTNPNTGLRNVDIICRFYGLLGAEVEALTDIANEYNIHITTASNVIVGVINALRRIYEQTKP